MTSDTYRNDGLILGGAPDHGGDAACVDATDLAVRGATPTLGSSPRRCADKPDKCNSTPMMIQFLPKAARVELTFATPGDRSIEVIYNDLTRTTITGSAVADDGSHGGIAYVIVSGRRPARARPSAAGAPVGEVRPAGRLSAPPTPVRRT